MSTKYIFSASLSDIGMILGDAASGRDRNTEVGKQNWSMPKTYFFVGHLRIAERGSGPKAQVVQTRNTNIVPRT